MAWLSHELATAWLRSCSPVPSLELVAQKCQYDTDNPCVRSPSLFISDTRRNLVNPREFLHVLAGRIAGQWR